MRRLSESSHWHEVPTTSVEINTMHFDGEWAMWGEYQYAVQGKTYQGQRIAFGDPTILFREEQLLAWWGHPASVNSFPKCWVNPRDPRDAVLARGRVRTGWWLPAIKLLVVGVVVLVAAVWMLRVRLPA